MLIAVNKNGLKFAKNEGVFVHIFRFFCFVFYRKRGVLFVSREKIFCLEREKVFPRETLFCPFLVSAENAIF